MTGALQEAEDKANRLGKTKGKLESTVQDVSICSMHCLVPTFMIITHNFNFIVLLCSSH